MIGTMTPGAGKRIYRAVSLPAEIDMANADHVGEQLVAAMRPGVTTVVADLSRTTFCDCHGARLLLQAHERAAKAGTELRVVVGGTAVSRLFSLLGYDQVLHLYPSLPAAFGRPPPPQGALRGAVRASRAPARRALAVAPTLLGRLISALVAAVSRYHPAAWAARKVLSINWRPAAGCVAGR